MQKFKLSGIDLNGQAPLLVLTNRIKSVELKVPMPENYQELREGLSILKQGDFSQCIREAGFYSEDISEALGILHRLIKTNKIMEPIEEEIADNQDDEPTQGLPMPGFMGKALKGS